MTRRFMLNRPKDRFKQYKLVKIVYFLNFIRVSLVFINKHTVSILNMLWKSNPQLWPKSYYWHFFRNEISHEIQTSPDLFTINVFITAFLKNSVFGVKMILWPVTSMPNPVTHFVKSLLLLCLRFFSFMFRSAILEPDFYLRIKQNYLWLRLLLWL